jgi:polyisoprenoid-binding protein YceI
MSWKLDQAHSQITFIVRHMMITNVRGRFETFDTKVDWNEADPTRSSVEVTIDVASINTRDAQRDGHLRSPDFFDAEKYPTITFKSKRIEKIDDARGRIVGDLTIRDVTREVVLDAEFSGQGKNPYGMTVAGFTTTTKINRKDWGLNWNVALETGGWLVGDEIKIEVELELIKQDVTQPAAVAA